MFAPTSIHADANWMERAVRSYVPEAEIIREFLPQEYIVARLSESIVNVALYAAHSGQSGISGSIRLALGAMRPLVLSRCGMYRDLFSYEEELYFLDSDVPTFENVLPVVAKALQDADNGVEKHPMSVVGDMSWWRCGRMYAQIYRDLLHENSMAVNQSA
jgi:hypothetical protein